MNTIKCRQCLQDFINLNRKKNQKYCNWNCFLSAARRTTHRVCAYCSKPFSINASSPKKYCSRNCFIEAAKKRYERICLFCNKVYLTEPHTLRKFCSHKCATDRTICEPPIKKEDLENRYFVLFQSLKEIAQSFKVSRPTVGKWLRYYSLPTLAKIDLALLKIVGGDWKYLLANKDLLVKLAINKLTDLYVAQNKHLREISKIVGVSTPTINNLLKTHGVNTSLHSLFGAPIATSSGCAVRSSYEYKVSEWLYQNKIPFEYEPRPFGNKKRSDFLINGTYVEIWGLDSPRYLENKSQKQKLYKKFNHKLIELYPQDFNSDTWKSKLSAALT